MTKRLDAIVVGLGGTGSAACYHLAKRGLRVVGLEQFTPVHQRGASHGETRGVWQAYFMGPSYVPLLQRAYVLWDELSELCSEPFFHRTGGICLGAPDGTLVPAARHSAEVCGLTHEVLDAAEVRRRFPMFHPDEGHVAIYDPSAGYVRPERVIATHLDLAKSAGATLRFGEAVLDCAVDAKGVQVKTDQGHYEADKLVLAVGAWLPKLVPHLAPPTRVLRKVMAWFDPIRDAQSFLPGTFPYWIWEADGMIGYGHPAVDGAKGGVKAGIHSGGDPADPDDLDRIVTREEIDAIRGFARHRLPQLPGAYLRSHVCMYDNTPDMGFVLGCAPSSDRVVLVGGTSGHAFKFVPALGEAVADLVTTGTSKQDLAMFAPGRFVRNPGNARTTDAGSQPCP